MSKSLVYVDSDEKMYFKSNRNNGLGYLSNFYPFINNNAKLAIDESLRDKSLKIESDFAPGFVFSNVESAFHGIKYYLTGPNSKREKIAKEFELLDGLEAKKLNTKLRKTDSIDVKEWDKKRDEVMLSLLESKFSDSDLKAALISTGKIELIEHPGRGKGNYWTGGSEGSNTLGKLLMSLRKSFIGYYEGYDEVYDEAYEKGYEDAKEEKKGRKRGDRRSEYREGRTDGWNDGYEEGYKDGKRDRKNKSKYWFTVLRVEGERVIYEVRDGSGGEKLGELCKEEWTGEKEIEEEVRRDFRLLGFKY